MTWVVSAQIMRNSVSLRPPRRNCVGIEPLRPQRAQGAEAINFDEDDPVKAILELTGGIGVVRAIDAVGTIRMGNCNHRSYIPKLVEYVRAGALDPEAILSKVEPLAAVIDAYRQFDKRQPGWLKVMLDPGATGPA